MQVSERSIGVLAAMAVLVLLLALPACDGSDDTPASPDLWPPTTAAVIAAMNTAIQAEYGAEGAYDEIIDQFGAVLPFTQVLAGEELHVAAVSNLFTRRGMSVPQPVMDPDAVPELASIAEACAYGVEAEKQLVAIYDELLDQALPNDVRQVFSNMRQASLTNHLPAFETCCACQ